MTNKKPKEELNSLIDVAIESNRKYIVTLVKLPNLLTPEAIINSRANFELKKEYINEAYDENLNHKFSKDVSIIGFMMCDNATEIVKMLDEYMYPTNNFLN